MLVVEGDDTGLTARIVVRRGWRNSIKSSRNTTMPCKWHHA